MKFADINQIKQRSQSKKFYERQWVKQLTPEIFVVKGYDLYAPKASCFSIAINDEVCAVVDTGPTGPFDQVWPRERVSVIVNSHFHMDHTRNNETFPNAEVWLHEADVPYLTNWERMRLAVAGERYGVEEGDSILREALYVLKRVDNTYTDGHVFEFGKTIMTTIHAPGHTPGHCMFYLPKEDILFTADIDLGTWGPGYGSPFSSIEHYLKSIDLIKQINPRLVVSGHEGIITDNIIGLADRYAQKIYQREELLLNSLRKPLDLKGLVELKNITPSYPTTMTRVFTMIIIEHHLDRLLKQGRIVQLDDGRYRQIKTAFKGG